MPNMLAFFRAKKKHTGDLEQITNLYSKLFYIRSTGAILTFLCWSQPKKNTIAMPLAVVVGAGSKWSAESGWQQKQFGKGASAEDLPDDVEFGISGGICLKLSEAGYDDVRW